MTKHPIRLLTALSCLGLAQAAGARSFRDSFAYRDGLVTDERAFAEPASLDARKAAHWEVTAGALFARSQEGATGDSAAVRMRTARRDFGDAAVSLRLLNLGLTSTPSTPERAWDGLQLWLRQQGEHSFYHVGVNRRDGTCDIKKKTPEHGGRYHNLAAGIPCPVPYGRWQEVRAEIRTLPDGSVWLALFSDGSMVVSAVDDGSVGGDPLRGTGAVGLRADNADLRFDDFSVTPLDGGHYTKR